jgi:pimeloyl-ACP methyl ester carboxylesterase
MTTKMMPSAIVLFILGTHVVHAEPNARTAKPAAPSGKQQAKPTLVLVHGAWADGSSWDKVTPLLQAKGYNVVAVHLPMSSATDDIATVKRVIDDQPGDVVLVGHSYGGYVISGAGDNPKVKNLVYVAAFALDDGETITGLSKSNPPPWTKALKVDRGGYAWLPAQAVTQFFAPDLPANEQMLITAKQGPLPTADFDAPARSPAWKKKPSFYVRATQDKIIDPQAQAMMAKRAHATITDVDASHVAMLSKPDAVANVILQAAGAPTATARK